VNVNLLLLATPMLRHGAGQQDPQGTFMRMGSLGGGIGAGVKACVSFSCSMTPK